MRQFRNENNQNIIYIYNAQTIHYQDAMLHQVRI